MVLVTTSISNEDSQNTQFRITKKLPTVCAGKRSRFSKPRPNLSISKRGESNGPVNAYKTSKNSEGDVFQTSLSSSIDTNKTSQECDSQVTSVTDVEEKSLENGVLFVSQKDTNCEIVDKEVTFTSHEDINEKIAEDNIKVIFPEVVNKYVRELSNEVISSTNSEKPVSKNEIQVISSTNTEILDLETDIQAFSNSNAEKLSPEEDIQVNSNTDVDKASEIDNRTRSAKNSGTSLKAPESEKRGISNTTPTVIDKSKYPLVTSLLSKKRTEPRKEVQQKRRKKFKKGEAPPERSKMTMADLIYWNPTKTDESQKSAVTEDETPSDNVVIEEECVDGEDESENNNHDSVPKLVISEDGQINIDQSSLFVSRNVTQPISTEVVRKDDTTYSSFRKRPLTKHWTAKDTANFYRALSLVGADFSLMEQIFPNRTRRELKQKFKREEKFNIDLINKVLYESQTFDELTLNDFMDQTSITDDPISINEKGAQSVVKEKSSKQKTSKKAKSTDNESFCSSIDSLEEESVAVNEKPQNYKGRKKKISDDDDDVEIFVSSYTNYNNTGEHKGSKRKRNAKKLPDDFVSIDSIEDLGFLGELETNNDNAFENTNSSENQENSNNPETENVLEEISESACDILSRMANGEENTGILQTFKEEDNNITVSLPLVTNNDEECTSVEYIKNDSGTDLTMLGNVMAFEVVNTLTPLPKKRRKINPISPGKTREVFSATKISPANYTNYTPV